jgi:primosomal protein N' (replication factor Y)
LHYNVAIISSPLSPLVYRYKEEIKPYTKVKVQLQNRVVDGVVLEKAQKPEFNTVEILEISEFFYSEFQYKLAKFISDYYICSLGDAFGVITPFKSGYDNSTDVKTQPIRIELLKKQKEAFEFIKKHKVSLLFGDTGSGKTEIYMKYFYDVISKNKRVIFLLPEISLTPQMESRLKNHFGKSVVMWHSKLTKKQKENNLEKIYSKEAKIIAGPRSALFLPIDDLGLIVVDEEHDDSYKSSSRPRYNARDLAVYMGKLLDINVVLGSATPTLTSYKKYPYFRLKESFYKSNKKFIYQKSLESLTPDIYELIKKTLQKKEQIIVFLPTRANFKYIICSDCGESYKCSFCNVGMSLHLKINGLKCHYCGFTQPIPKVCYKCGGSNLVSSRLGTAEVVKDLKEQFKDAVIEQFDRDAITTQAKLKKVLKSFNNKEIDILVGTQMLSKGHDYHDVTLAVILGMDNMLNIPDFRAREKAISSLIQISGRSGRKKDAVVFIQSYNEDFFSTYLNDYELFLEDELFFREDLYPPFKRIARVLFSHKNYNKAKEAMELMKEKLLEFKDILEIVGSGECGINKVANKYRFEILLRSDKATNLLKAIKSSMVDLAEVDMDPVDFN